MSRLARTDVLARAGYAARGFVYVLLGWFAWQTRSSAKEGQEGVFARVQEMTAGSAMLAVLVVGLIAYGIYKLSAGLFDIERHGHDAKGIAARFGMVAGSVAYLFLAWGAARFASHSKESAETGGGAEMARTLLDVPLGNGILALVGAGFITAAIFQVRSAWTRSFMKRIEPGAPRLTCTMGRIGFSARAVVFLLVGISLVSAALRDNGGEARDLGGVLADIQGQPLLYSAVTLGLLVFGLFSLIEARYRIVESVDVAKAAAGKVGRA